MVVKTRNTSEVVFRQPYTPLGHNTNCRPKDLGQYNSLGVYCDPHTASSVIPGGQSGAAVSRPHGNHQDVGSNPATARNENQTWGTPTEGGPRVWTGSQWKTGDVKPN